MPKKSVILKLILDVGNEDNPVFLAYIETIPKSKINEFKRREDKVVAVCNYSDNLASEEISGSKYIKTKDIIKIFDKYNVFDIIEIHDFYDSLNLKEVEKYQLETNEIYNNNKKRIPIRKDKGTGKVCVCALLTILVYYEPPIKVLLPTA